MAKIFEETAANEKEHAKIWFKLLNGGEIPDTATCLKMAAGGEHEEWTEMYPRMAKEAKEEGFNQIAALFTMVAGIEKEHEERYLALAENLANSQVFAREEQQVWQCSNCGYTYIGKSAPLKCPVCAHPQAYFELKVKNYAPGSFLVCGWPAGAGPGGLTDPACPRLCSPHSRRRRPRA